MNAAQSRLASLGAVIRSAVLHPGVQAMTVIWIIGNVAVVLLAGGFLPFDRPALADMQFAQQVALPSLGLIEVFVLMAVVYLLTRQRVVPDLAARAPECSQAARETALVLGYAALGQVGGWLVGPALGYRPFSFHIAGTLVGCSVPPSVGELWTWAIYNFVVFAVVPFFWFRRRYSSTQTEPALHQSRKRSTGDRRGDGDRKPGRTWRVSWNLSAKHPPASDCGAACVRRVHDRDCSSDHGADLRNPYSALPQADRLLCLHGSAGRCYLCRHARRRRLVGVHHPAGNRPIPDIRRSAIFRPGHDEDRHNAAHRQRLGPCHRLPLHCAAYVGRRAADGQGVRPEVRRRIAI